MANLVDHLAAQLEGKEEVRGLPFMLIGEIARLVLEDLDDQGLIDSSVELYVWCDACGTRLERQEAVCGTTGEEMCRDCGREFLDEEE